MSVPEISVHEHSQSNLRKNEIGASGNFASSSPSRNSGDLHQLDQTQFGGGITRTSNQTHYLGTLEPGKDVWHFGISPTMFVSARKTNPKSGIRNIVCGADVSLLMDAASKSSRKGAMLTTMARRIDNSCLANMWSPIRFIMQERLQASIFTIAPERQKQFNTALDDFDLVYLDEPRWIFGADPEKKTIFVSRGAMELIWCASLAHFLFYYHFIQGKDFSNQRTEIDPHSHPDVDKALTLLKWALENHFHPEAATQWPAGLPAPVENPAPESDLAVANELYLVTCAFLLHHELAHIAGGHIRSDEEGWSLDQEKEADNEAVDWVLGLVPIDDPRFQKRILGIAQGSVLTAAISLYRKTLGGGGTHPFAYDRLSSVLNRFVSGDPHTAKDMAFSILDLHFHNSKRGWDGGPFEDSAEALEALCNRLADEAHGRIGRDGKKI